MVVFRHLSLSSSPEPLEPGEFRRNVESVPESGPVLPPCLGPETTGHSVAAVYRESIDDFDTAFGLPFPDPRRWSLAMTRSIGL